MAAALCVAIPGPARLALAQKAEAVDVAAPGYVSFVEGRVTLERDGDAEEAVANMPVVPGDRLRTAAGRVEILFPDRSTLALDYDTSISVLTPLLLQVSAGRGALTVTGANDPSRVVHYQIDTPAAMVENEGAGEFLVSVLIPAGDGPDETGLAVLRGEARLVNNWGTTLLRSGERGTASGGGALTQPDISSSQPPTPFDDWVNNRRSQLVSLSSSPTYLPADLQMFDGALSQSGTWGYTASYGYVWYPVVAQDWRPFYRGRWTLVRGYGWTWVGRDAWSWPTHHYGRWGNQGGAWFWIPGRAWSPAWVTWADAPGFVGWSPLGVDAGNATGGAQSAWAGWTVLPKASFGRRRDAVDRYAVAVQQLPTTLTFVPRAVPPTSTSRSAIHGPAGPALAASTPSIAAAARHGARAPVVGTAVVQQRPDPVDRDPAAGRTTIGPSGRSSDGFIRASPIATGKGSSSAGSVAHDAPAESSKAKGQRQK